MEAAGEDLSEGWFQLLRLIKRVGLRIIEFLAQIEDFQKMLWEKKSLSPRSFTWSRLATSPKPFTRKLPPARRSGTSGKSSEYLGSRTSRPLKMKTSSLGSRTSRPLKTKTSSLPLRRKTFTKAGTPAATCLTLTQGIYFNSSPSVSLIPFLLR
jgi:hypothetical protein